MDPSTGYFYYYNHSNGESQYELPRLLKRYGRGIDYTLPWSIQWRTPEENKDSAATGASVPYYYNVTTGEVRDDSPEGYRVCQSCRFYLACRQCDGPGCDGKTSPPRFLCPSICLPTLGEEDACVLTDLSLSCCLLPYLCPITGYKYCFACFRSYHLSWSIRMCRGDHEGVPIKPVKCGRCKVQMAGRTCNDCGVELCKSCYGRVHRNPLLTHHTWVPLS